MHWTEQTAMRMEASSLAGAFSPIHRTAPYDWLAIGPLEETREARLGAKVRTKRAMDVALASLLIVLATPVLLLAMLAVGLTSRGPIIFRQRRVGYRRQEFIIFKLRTMYTEPTQAPALPVARIPPPELSGTPPTGRIFEKIKEGDGRVTPAGRVLRKLSLDELPQLFNVLRGEMSLVGPRPLSSREMRSLPPGRAMRRFDVKPGITGLWQVSGRSLLSDAERIRLDVEYVERWSPWLDFKIIIRTPPAVVLARGAL